MASRPQGLRAGGWLPRPLRELKFWAVFKIRSEITPNGNLCHSVGVRIQPSFQTRSRTGSVFQDMSCGLSSGSEPGEEAARTWVSLAYPTSKR